jgi:hypothetical protein
MKSQDLGKTLTCGRYAASGSVNSRSSLLRLLSPLAINRIRSAVRTGRMLHKL